jgi:D-psicose/D-tagatose/L-ribulose 3-epimerase
MNKIGFNLLAWSSGISDELFPISERLKEIGYDGIECFLGSDENKVYKHFGEHIRNLELDITCVMVLGADEDPISDSLIVRNKGLDRIKWAIDRASDMESKIICGPFHSAYANFSKKAPQNEEYKRGADILLKAGEYAKEAGVVLALEAVNRFECYLCNTMDQLLKLVNLVSHPNVQALYDTHHSNIEEKNIKEAIDKISPVLSHVHISENDRGTPGKGQVLWDDTFSALAEIGYQGWFTIEAFTLNDPDFANLINVWREYSAPWEIAEQGFKFIQHMSDKYGF